jgi:CRP/FNR family cyclic AMP-dependent transcriptional regulator
MHRSETKLLETAGFPAILGSKRTLVVLKPKDAFYSQGDPSDSIFLLQTGRAKLAVVSNRGKEAVVTLLTAGDFFGEESLVGTVEFRPASAKATTACKAFRIAKEEMLRLLRTEPQLSVSFLTFILNRSIKTQEDLIDQLFNSSERRLARTLLLMAEFGKPEGPETLLPPISQEVLAEMIGTTRSRVSFFMNRFRKLGYIDYNGRIRVDKSLLNVVLHDQLPEENTSRPRILDPPPSQARTARRKQWTPNPILPPTQGKAKPK